MCEGMMHSGYTGGPQLMKTSIATNASTPGAATPLGKKIGSKKGKGKKKLGALKTGKKVGPATKSMAKKVSG